MSDGVQRSVTIVNRKGLHARAAAAFVRLAGGYDARVTVQAKGQSVSGHSIMGLMLLAAGPGTPLVICTEGAEAEQAAAALAKLVTCGFDEGTA
jgi:phosphocarrier protein HPr